MQLELLLSSKELSPRLVDKLTLATEEGTKLVSALYSSLAFYKDRYEEHDKIRRLIHLRVERPCVSRRVSACLSPITLKGEEMLLIRPRTTY